MGVEGLLLGEWAALLLELEARGSALLGLTSPHLSHIVPVFSFTLGLKTKVKEKGKAGSSCFRPSPGWDWPWGTQADLASLEEGGLFSLLL